MRVWVRTVGQTRHMPRAKYRPPVSGTHKVAAGVVERGGEVKDPLHGEVLQSHVVKSRFPELTCVNKWPYGRLVVLCQAAEKGFGTCSCSGMQTGVDGEGLLKMPQWSGQRVK